MRLNSIPYIVLALIGYGHASVAIEAPAVTPAPSPTALPADVEEMLWWLPEDTETLVVSRGPFRLFAKNTKPGGNLSILLPVGALDKSFGERTVSLAMEGSRHYRLPQWLGITPYEGSCVLRLQPDPARPLAQILRKFAAGKKQYSLAGHSIIYLEQNWNREIWKFYITAPAPDVLFIASNEKYLISMLYRMRYRRAQRALPAHLPQWRHVDAAATYWAVRHYDQRQTKRNRVVAHVDPTSPLAYNNMLGKQDPHAVGLVFVLDAARNKTARVYYLSQHADALPIARSHWWAPGQGVKPGFRVTAPGVVEISAELDDENSGMLNIMLFWFLGHGVVV